LGLASDEPFRKCARVVGEVLGRYHPHGDSAVYESLMRMAQGFAMGTPLVDGHGNFGSTDGDPAAAMRYTECKLTAFAEKALLADVGLSTVDFVQNFDGSATEPVVLPTRVPNLLLNGATGIAVGMATNIPPHNLLELSRAVKLLIADPDVSDERLLTAVPAPDFPTGGEIVCLKECRKLYSTGRGGVTVRGKTHFETLSGAVRQNREAIIVTELPFQVNKAMLIERMAGLVDEKKLEGISDLRDESDRDGTRIVIELRRNANRDIVLNNLFKKTGLQSSFQGNFVALAGGRQPERYTLRTALMAFLEFRRTTVRKRAKHQRERAEDRLHVVDGFTRAQENIDGVVAMIRASSDASQASASLQAKFSLSSAQADAILSMPLRRLTALEHEKLLSEASDLRNTIVDIISLLDKPERIDDIIKKELDEAIATAGGEKNLRRRTSVSKSGGELDLDEVALVANEPSIILVTVKGFIKRMQIAEFSSKRRGTRGKADDDFVKHFMTCNNHDTVLFFTQRGMAFGLPAFKIPEVGRAIRGTPLQLLLTTLPSGERVTSVLAVSSFAEDNFLLMMSINGLVKKTSLSLFQKLTQRGLTCMTLKEDDELGWARLCSEEDSIMIGSKSGKYLRFLVDKTQLRPTGRNSRGVKSIKMGEGDVISDMDVVRPSESDVLILAVLCSGYVKISLTSDFCDKKRGLVGDKAITLVHDIAARKSTTDAPYLVAFRKCRETDIVMLVSSTGTIIRQNVAEILKQSDQASGSELKLPGKYEMVAAVAVVPSISGG